MSQIGDLPRSTYITIMKRHADDLNFVQAASALAIEQAQFSNLLRQKRFAGRKSSYRHERLISRAEIALLFGRTLTDTEFLRARTVRAKSPSTEAKRQAALGVMMRETLAKLLPYDAGYVRAAVEARDQTWQNRLLAKNIEMASPPMPVKLIPDMTAQEIFSRASVEILLVNAARERDMAWFSWTLDPVERAQFPNGPEQLKI
jgi:hypothetical protein